ncbi:MAG: Ig-like domain-containing protein, partial [Acidobacteriota bacterium]
AGNLTFTPAANAYGSATVSVTAHDDGGTADGGVDTSASQTFTISVNAVNDAPSFTKGGDVSLLEDAGAYSQAGWATAISAGPNEGSQTVNFIVSNNNAALFSVQPSVSGSGTLSFLLAPNANGSATVTVAAHDDGGTANGGVDTSAAQTFTITVTPVNDAPSFTKGADQTSLEDGGAQTVAGWATAISAGPPDESGQTVTFTTTNDNNPLFSVQPSVASDGSLTYTAAPDAFGTAMVTMTAHDDGGTANGGVDSSAPQSFTITISPVNDAPSFTKGPDEAVISDAGPQTYTNWATAISAGPANESGQVVNFVVTNDNNAVFTSQPAITSSGTLTFTTALAAPTTTVHVTVVAHDNGGTANGGVDTSAPQTFNVNVTHANQPPVANPDSFDAVGNTELAVGTTGAQAATLVTTGSVLANDSDPDGDPLTATLGTVGSGATVTLNSDGTFRFLPAANFTGDVTFTYNVSDGAHVTLGSVTVHVTKRVLYVKNDAPSGGNGRVDSPYSVLATAGAAAADNDTIYIFSGNGTTSNQNAGVTLSHDGNRLIGEGVALTASGTYNSVVNPTLRAAGTRPQISNGAGSGVTVQKTPAAILNGAEISGVDIVSSLDQGVKLVSVAGIKMNSDHIASTLHSGVRGTGVSDFSFTNGTISASGTVSGDSNISFDDTATASNVAGTFIVTNSSLTTAWTHGISIANTSGTLSNVTITGNTITSSTSSAASFGSAIRITENGTATTVARIVQSTVANNSIANFPNGGGILIQGNSAAGGPSSQLGTAGSSTDLISVTGNQIAGQSAVVRMATQAINVSVSRTGTGNFNISGNGTLTAPLANLSGAGIAVGAFGNVTVTSTMNNNFLSPRNIAGNGGIVVGVDQTAASTEVPDLTATITNNVIAFTDGNGILATARNSNGALRVKIQNNTVAAPLSGARPGIRVDSGNGAGNASVCLNITGNTAAGSGGLQGIGLRKQGTSPVINAFGINGMAATSTPGVEAYVNGLNPTGGGTILLSATSGFTNCPLP